MTWCLLRRLYLRCVCCAAVGFAAVGRVAETAGQISTGQGWDPAVPLPKFITHHFVAPENLVAIAKYRSNSGHAFSDSYEPGDRSLKNYFVPKRRFLNTRDLLPVYAPATGTLTSVTAEGHLLSNGESRGVQVWLTPDGYPDFDIRLFHVHLAAGLAVGSRVTGGEPIGFADLREAVNTDWAVAAVWNAMPVYGAEGEMLRPPGYRLLSPFDLMNDGAFAAFSAFGVEDRERFVVPLAYRAAHPATFSNGSSGLDFDVSEYLVLADAPTIAQQPQNRVPLHNENVELSVAASDAEPLTYRWHINGFPHYSANTPVFTLEAAQPVNAGLYTVVVTGELTTTSDPAIVGIGTSEKVIGAARELQPANIYVAANGNTFDQVLLEGPAATITADFPLRQISRISFVDLTSDIVQVELSGPGTLSLVLDNPSGPARPINYEQNVDYMTGHAGIVITGANEDTHVAVFSVGAATAVNQALFKPEVAYDGWADIAFIAVASSNGKFGGIRAANTRFLATRGLTGIYAPGVQFHGPVYVGDIVASDAATPAIVLGSVGDARITGGELFQSNGKPIVIAGLTRLNFTAGTDSHGRFVAEKANRGVLQQGGVDVTAWVVEPSAP